MATKNKYCRMRVSTRWAAATALAALGLIACGNDRPCDAATRPAAVVIVEGASPDDVVVEYSVDGEEWRPCEGLACGHNVFGTVTVRGVSGAGETVSESVESRRVDHCGGTSFADAPRVTLVFGGGADATDGAPIEPDVGVTRDAAGTTDTRDTREEREEREAACDDRTDNDRDGDTDCEDMDCDAFCIETACDDGIDNNGDGYTDACDLNCSDRPPLGCPGEYHANSIGDPGAQLSYVRRVALMPGGALGCCADFDGDGAPDSALAAAAALLQESALEVDLQREISQAIEAGRVAFVFEWQEVEWWAAPERQTWLYLSTNDVDGDGAADQDVVERGRGDGVFRILPDSVDGWGAKVQLRYPTQREPRFATLPLSTPALVLPFAPSFSPSPITLRSLQMVLSGEYVDTTRGRESVDEPAGGDGSGAGSGEGAHTHGGWALGGLVRLDDVAEAFEAGARACPCAGYSADAIVSYGDDGDRYNFACVQQPDSGCSESPYALCRSLSAICDLGQRLVEAGVNDVDTDNNGVGDAMSFGVRLSTVGAAWAHPPFVAAAEVERR